MFGKFPFCPVCLYAFACIAVVDDGNDRIKPIPDVVSDGGIRSWRFFVRDFQFLSYIEIPPQQGVHPLHVPSSGLRTDFCLSGARVFPIGHDRRNIPLYVARKVLCRGIFRIVIYDSEQYADCGLLRVVSPYEGKYGFDVVLSLGGGSGADGRPVRFPRVWLP